MFKSIDAELSTKSNVNIPSMNKLVPLFNETLYNAPTVIPDEYQIAKHVTGYNNKGGRRKSRRRKHKKRHTKKKRTYKNKKKSRHTK